MEHPIGQNRFDKHVQNRHRDVNVDQKMMRLFCIDRALKLFNRLGYVLWSDVIKMSIALDMTREKCIDIFRYLQCRVEIPQDYQKNVTVVTVNPVKQITEDGNGNTNTPKRICTPETRSPPHLKRKKPHRKMPDSGEDNMAPSKKPRIPEATHNMMSPEWASYWSQRANLHDSMVDASLKGELPKKLKQTKLNFRECLPTHSPTSDTDIQVTHLQMNYF